MMVTQTKENPSTEAKEKVLEFESAQKRVAQVAGDIEAAKQAIDAEENKYRQIPNDETGKAARLKSLEDRDKHRASVESLRKGFSLEVAEVFLNGASERIQAFRQEFESIRNRAEKLVRDIAAANQAADEQLEQYRIFLHDGEKLRADEALENVSKHRKHAEALIKQFPELLSEADRLKQPIEDLRLRTCTFSSAGLLDNIKLRLEIAHARVSGVLSACSHTLGECEKLKEFTRKQAL